MMMMVVVVVVIWTPARPPAIVVMMMVVVVMITPASPIIVVMSPIIVVIRRVIVRVAVILDELQTRLWGRLIGRGFSQKLFRVGYGLQKLSIGTRRHQFGERFYSRRSSGGDRSQRRNSANQACSFFLQELLPLETSNMAQ
jgi:hypothetical protein